MTHNTKEVETKLIIIKKKKTAIKKNNTINLILNIELLCRADTRIEVKSNWDLEISELNHPTFQY